jgi:hypothetical protein
MLMLSRFFRDRSGVTAIATAIGLVVLAGFAACAVDVSAWMAAKRQVQNATDQAAYSAVIGGTAGGSGYTNALAVLAQSGYGCPGNAVSNSSGRLTCNGANGSTVEVNSPPSQGSYTEDSTAWEVIVSQPQHSWFAQFFLASPPSVSGRAVGLQGGNVCILALDTRTGDIHSIFGGNSASVTIGGSCEVADNLLNSSDTDDVDVKSGATLNFNTLYMRDASKCDSTSCQGTLITTNPILYNKPAIVNPYASRTIPAASGSCNYTNLVISTTQTLSPGTYCGTGGSAALTVSAGTTLTLSPPPPPPPGTTVLTFASTTGVVVGMTVTDETHPSAIPSGTTVKSTTATTVTVSATVLGGPAGAAPNDLINFAPSAGVTVTLSSGVYIFDGQGGGSGANACTGSTKPTGCLSGDLEISNNAVVSGSGVTIVLTTSKGVGIDVGNVYITNGGSLSITAPTSNVSGYQVQGIALWQNPLAPNPSGTDGNMYTTTSDGVNTITSGSSTDITGLVYFPSQGLLYSGGSGGNVCTQIVAFSVVFQYSAQFNYPTNCTSTSGELPIGATPKLAE